MNAHTIFRAFAHIAVGAIAAVSLQLATAQGLSGKASTKSLTVVQTVVGDSVKLTAYYGGVTFIPNVGFNMSVLGKEITNSPLTDPSMIVGHRNYGPSLFTANQMIDISRKSYITADKIDRISSVMSRWMQQNGIASGAFVFQQEVDPKRGDEKAYEAGVQAFRIADSYPACEASDDAKHSNVSVDCSIPEAATKGLCFKVKSNCSATDKTDRSGQPCYRTSNLCNGCDSTGANKANSPSCAVAVAAPTVAPGLPGASAGSRARLVWQLVITPTGQALYGNPKVVGTTIRTAYISYISNSVDIRLNPAWRDQNGGLMRWIEKTREGKDDSQLFQVETGGAYDEAPDTQANAESALDNDGLYCLANHNWTRKTPGATKVCNTNYPDAATIVDRAGAAGIVIDYVRKVQPQNKLQTANGETDEVANFLVLRYDSRVQTTNIHMNMTCVVTTNEKGESIKTCSPPVEGCRDRIYSTSGSKQFRLNQITDRYLYSSGEVLPVLVNRAERKMDSPTDTFADTMYVPITMEMDNWLFNPFNTKFTDPSTGRRLVEYMGGADSVDTTARISPAPKDYFVAPLTRNTVTYVHEKSPGGPDYRCDPGSM